MSSESRPLLRALGMQQKDTRLLLEGRIRFPGHVLSNEHYCMDNSGTIQSTRFTNMTDHCSRTEGGPKRQQLCKGVRGSPQEIANMWYRMVDFTVSR
jgi:hypothetical protein